MEEVDSIILETLREIGCELDEDVRLKNMSPEIVFKSISTLCQLIKPEADVLKTLPAQMAHRFAAASQLVDCVKGLGFNGNLGYQTILYSNISELRRVFMWLIERLPKSEDKTDSYQTRAVSKAKSIENEIAKKLNSDLKKPWILGFLQTPSSIKFDPIELEKPCSREVNEYEERFLVPIFHQTKSILPSVIATHDADLMKKSIPSSESSEISKKLRNAMAKSTQSLNLLTSSSISTLSSVSNLAGSEKTVESAPVPIQKSLQEILKEKVESLNEQIDEQEDMFRHLTFNRDEISRKIENDRTNLEKVKKESKLKMQVAMLLDNPEESIEKLEQTLNIAKQKKQTLNSKFESHKVPLLQHLDALSGTNSVKLKRINEARESIKHAKHSLTEIQEDIKHKVLLQQNLIEELNKKKRTTERAAYTSRIADIINNIRKQNNDINEVLKDTRALQKAINAIEGQLERQFLVTEELVFTKTSKQDEYSKKAYKLLISLHTEFSELITLIENTGSIQREIRELEDQIENERQQNVQQKIDQITRDLQLIEESSGSK